MAGKKFLTINLVLMSILLISFGLVARAQEIDLTTGQPFTKTATTSLTPLVPFQQGGRILWDTSHGIYLYYSPSGRFSALTALLESKGYIMDENNQGVLNVDLSQYGIIVVCLGSAWNTPYSAGEVSAIENFVRRGGGLLIMGDNTATPNDNINPVAQAFGTTCGISTLEPLDTYITDFASHPILDGISEIYMRAAGEIDATAPSEEIAWHNGLGAVAAATVGLGKVVITGDMNLMDDDYISEVDNQLFSENTFDWLKPCPATVVTSNAGVIGSLRRFRDTALAENETWQFLIDEYYYHSPEIVQILLRHPILSIRSAAILKNVMPGIRFLLGDKNGRNIVMTPWLVTRIQKLFADISEEGSDDLADTLSFLSDVLDVCKGMRISEIW